MKAVVYKEYGDPSVLQVIEMDKPKINENEVLVKVGASGINPVDTYFRSGIRQVPSFPHIPHFDVAGTVVEVGSDVSKWNVGDRVWGTNVKGSAAEYITANEEVLFPLSSHLSEEEGAAIAMAFATAHIALFFRAELELGETVLIYGAAGAVGNAAVQLAKAKGAHVIATASSEEKAAVAKDAGADDVIIYTKDNISDKVSELTNSNGLSVILDMSVSENIEKNLEMIQNGGRIVTIGSPKNNTPTLPWRLLNQKNANLLGVLLFTVPPKELQRAGAEISSLFKEKKLKAHLAKSFSFEDAALAHQAIENKTYSGNIVLTP
ncbi:NADPH:quinone reductase [Bacillus sp. FJAT-45350]|uniref:NADPH:quinone reductase n=1 Tax=Bacillus sp. FJAT-45350 TaxID=2011014 RepID=UPI000BB7DC6A|nr:NADPH:quinone reductase [Bacillus sp. FJAT-45350]